MSNDDLQAFTDALKRDGWAESEPFKFEKHQWQIVFDTSSWMELGTTTTPRLFDVPVPADGPINKIQWTINLITHL